MTLDEFLRREALTEGAFAALIGTTQATVNRYRRGLRVPPRPVMRRISDATGGCVQANDFHVAEIGHPPHTRDGNGAGAVPQSDQPVSPETEAA